MTRYALRRIAWTVPVLFLVVTLLFCMMQAIGGDPLRPGKLQGLSNLQGWVKRGDPKALVIVASADIQSSTHKMVDEAGALAFIHKPFVPEQVLAAVDTALAEGAKSETN